MALTLRQSLVLYGLFMVLAVAGVVYFVQTAPPLPEAQCSEIVTPMDVVRGKLVKDPQRSILNLWNCEPGGLRFPERAKAFLKWSMVSEPPMETFGHGSKSRSPGPVKAPRSQACGSTRRTTGGTPPPAFGGFT
ncbi:unnamed protein product [Effrenium voratum]|nr:unnamed protein product [Effrenium voratum]